MIYGPGFPIKIGQDNIWQGKDKTNGFLMRNVDGRIPALKQSFARMDIGASSALNAAGVVPYGNGLWRDLSTLDTEPGVVKAEKPSTSRLVGIAEFNQGWQTGHPVQGWGVPAYGRADMICAGYVGYKVTMAAVGQDANYLKYLQGDKTQDIAATRQLYKDWMTTWKAGADGSRLGLFFANVSGFPVMSLVTAANINNPTLANCTFGGFVEITEPENEAVFIKFNL